VTDSRPSVPPTGNMLVLAADLLAMRARKLLEQLAHANWEPADQLKSALDTYSEVRQGGIIEAAQQCAADEEPPTLRSQPHIAIDHVPGVDEP